MFRVRPFWWSCAWVWATWGVAIVGTCHPALPHPQQCHIQSFVCLMLPVTHSTAHWLWRQCTEGSEGYWEIADGQVTFHEGFSHWRYPSRAHPSQHIRCVITVSPALTRSALHAHEQVGQMLHKSWCTELGRGTDRYLLPWALVYDSETSICIPALGKHVEPNTLVVPASGPWICMQPLQGLGSVAV